MRKAVNSPCPAAAASSTTRAKTMNRSAKPPLVIHIFSPVSRKLPSACRTARALALNASDPDPDSLSAYAPISSPDTSRGT